MPIRWHTRVAKPPLSCTGIDQYWYPAAGVISRLGWSCAVESEERNSLPGKMNVCLHTIQVGVGYGYIFLCTNIGCGDSVSLPDGFLANRPHVCCGAVDGAVERFFDAIGDAIQHPFRLFQCVLTGCCDMNAVAGLRRLSVPKNVGLTVWQ